MLWAKRLVLTIRIVKTIIHFSTSVVFSCMISGCFCYSYDYLCYRGIFNVVIVVQVGVPVCQALLAYGKQQYDEVRTLYSDVYMYHKFSALHIHNGMY